MSAAPTPLAIAPRVHRWRLPTGVTLALVSSTPPLGVARVADLVGPIEQGDAVLIVPPASILASIDATSPAALAEALPDPRSVAGAIVVVAPMPARTGWLARLSLRRATPLARSVRGAALLLRGYRRVGGGLDAASGLDLAWGE